MKETQLLLFVIRVISIANLIGLLRALCWKSKNFRGTLAPAYGVVRNHSKHFILYQRIDFSALMLYDRAEPDTKTMFSIICPRYYTGLHYPKLQCYAVRG